MLNLQTDFYSRPGVVFTDRPSALFIGLKADVRRGTCCTCATLALFYTLWNSGELAA